MTRPRRYADGLYKAKWGQGLTRDVRLKTIAKGQQIVLDLEGQFCEELTNAFAVSVVDLTLVPYICADELVENGGKSTVVDNSIVEDVYTVCLPHRTWQRPTQEQYDRFIEAVNRLWMWVYRLRQEREEAQRGDVFER